MKIFKKFVEKVKTHKEVKEAEKAIKDVAVESIKECNTTIDKAILDKIRR